jgi:hypothetical protein
VLIPHLSPLATTSGPPLRERGSWRVTKKGRTSAHIRCDDRREFRVSYQRRERLAQRGHAPVLSVSEQRRAAFHTGDRVHFPFRGRTVQGVLICVNPTHGHEATEDGSKYRVSYCLLQLLEAQAEATRARSHAQLEEIAPVAYDLLRHHALPQESARAAWVAYCFPLFSPVSALDGGTPLNRRLPRNLPGSVAKFMDYTIY